MNSRVLKRNSASRYRDLGDSHKYYRWIALVLYKIPIFGNGLKFLQGMQLHFILSVGLVIFSKDLWVWFWEIQLWQEKVE